MIHLHNSTTMIHNLKILEQYATAYFQFINAFIQGLKQPALKTKKMIISVTPQQLEKMHHNSMRCILLEVNRFRIGPGHEVSFSTFRFGTKILEPYHTVCTQTQEISIFPTLKTVIIGISAQVTLILINEEVQELAIQLGYDDQHHFFSRFKHDRDMFIVHFHDDFIGRNAHTEIRGTL